MTLADPESAGQGWACGMRNAEVQVPRDIDSGQPSTLRSLGVHVHDASRVLAHACPEQARIDLHLYQWVLVSQKGDP